MKKRFLLLFIGAAVLLLATGLLAGCQASGTSVVQFQSANRDLSLRRGQGNRYP